MQFEFSYVGLFYLIMLIVPKFIWSKYRPQDYKKYVASITVPSPIIFFKRAQQLT